MGAASKYWSLAPNAATRAHACAEPPLVGKKVKHSRARSLLALGQLLVLDRRLHLLGQLRRDIVYAMGRLSMFGSLLHHLVLSRATRDEVAPLHQVATVHG